MLFHFEKNTVYIITTTYMKYDYHVLMKIKCVQRVFLEQLKVYDDQIQCCYGIQMFITGTESAAEPYPLYIFTVSFSKFCLNPSMSPT
jgi:hypothetical protein